MVKLQQQEIQLQLGAIYERQGTTMASIDDLQTDMDDLKAFAQKQNDLIATLTAQLAAGGTTIPADVQAKIDAIDAEAKAILAGPAPTV